MKAVHFEDEIQYGNQTEKPLTVLVLSLRVTMISHNRKVCSLHTFKILNLF